MSSELTREYHPAANLFPLLNGDDYEQLKADIEANGLLESIWLTKDGAILDGRNRHRACIDLGIEPRFRTYQGDSPVSFVVSLNLTRRHLTASQKAMLAVDVLPMLEEEARERQRATMFGGGNISTTGDKLPAPKSIRDAYPDVFNGKARDQAGAMFDVSGRYVSDAKRIADEDPALAEQVRTGEKTIPQAKREIVKREADALSAAPVALPSGLYRTIVVDPPWPIEKIEREVAPNQYAMDYPTMSLEQIAAWDGAVRIAADDCHLFLWTTQKYLPASFDIIREWGFRYVFTMVWHKPGGFQPFNLPQYNAEFIVYGRRGTPVFDDLKDFMTCFSAPRAGHSVKPAEFYDTLARVAPGPRVEMFARGKRSGFDGWGNESE